MRSISVLWFGAIVAVTSSLAIPAAATISECPAVDGITCDGWVTDAAGVLSDESRVEAAAARIVGNTGNEIAVVLVADSGSRQPRDLAEDIGNSWGVGFAERDDGIVLLVSLEERRTELVTGPGVELDDAQASSIAGLADSSFGAGDFDAGVLAMLASLESALVGGGQVAETAPGTGSSGGVGRILLLVVAVIGIGGVWLYRRQSGRREHEERRRVRQSRVDEELARLTPAGHEIALPEDLFVEAPSEPVPSVETTKAMESLAQIASGTAPSDEAVLRDLWVGRAVGVGDADSIERYRELPLEMRVSGEQELLENAVQEAARTAVDQANDEAFEIEKTNLRGLVDSLRPYRVAEASQRLAREVARRTVDTQIGPTIITDLGERLLQMAPLLQEGASLEQSLLEVDEVYRVAAEKTARMEELYRTIPDQKARPAVAAALADLSDDADEAATRYHQILSKLEAEGKELAADGLELPAVAAFLLMNNDEDMVEEFVATYRQNKALNIEPPVAVEMALAGLRTEKELNEIREEAGRLSLPVSIAAALVRRGGRAVEDYETLVAELARETVETEAARTIAAVLAMSLEPAQALRRWSETRRALGSVGLDGTYADVAAAFGASDPRGPRAFALAYAAQRQALSRSSIDDADRYAPELAHGGTARQRDSWTGERIPSGLGWYDPYFFFYYHWVMTGGMSHALGWDSVYRDRSWSDDRNSWFGGFGGGGGFGQGGSWGSSWGSGGSPIDFGGFGGGGFGGGGGGGGSGW